MSSRPVRLPVAKPHRSLLTTRQTQVKDILLDGGTNRDIAKDLGISEETVKRHITDILNATGQGSRSELMVYYFSKERARLLAEIDRLSQGIPLTCPKCETIKCVLEQVMALSQAA